MQYHINHQCEKRRRPLGVRSLAVAVAAVTGLLAPTAFAATPSETVVLPGEVKAVALSSEEMDAIHGEGLGGTIANAIIKQAVKAVSRSLGTSVGDKLEKLLSGATTPTFAQYQKAFGAKTALVLSLLPSILQPKIAR